MVLTDILDAPTQKKPQFFFIVKTSSLAEDQRLIESSDIQEQTSLEQKFLNGTNEEEEKISKKIKREKNEV